MGEYEWTTSDTPVLTTWQKRLSLPENQRNLSTAMNNSTLENVTHDKLLGVIIDHNLSLEKHITTIVSTINIKSALLRRIKQYMPVSTRKLFFNTHILSHIDYCAIIWAVHPIHRTCY